MSEYTLPHDLAGERERLALMSALLDPMERAHIEPLEVKPGWRCLELGAGNASISPIPSGLVALSGHVVASDIDVRYMADLNVPCLEVRGLDAMRDPIGPEAYDFGVAGALLHHLPGKAALKRMVEALKPGGVILWIEPRHVASIPSTPIRHYWTSVMTFTATSGVKPA
jgi:hypothetical protein